LTQIVAMYRAIIHEHDLFAYERIDDVWVQQFIQRNAASLETALNNEATNLPSFQTQTVYLVLRIEVSAASEWFNDEAPPDNLNPDSVKRFIDITHEAYRQAVGDDFGKTVKGIFADEPGLHDTHTCFHPQRGWIPWTYSLAKIFQEKYQRDVFDDAPLIWFHHKDSAAIRHDYWQLITEQYVQCFSQQISQWCERNNLSYTGHFLQENRIGLSVRVGGAVMPHFVHQHVPGVDLLMEQCDEYLTIRQCTSVANQYSRPWVLTETYGCTGWGFTFEGQKWLGDWQYVQGVTRRCQHLALYSLRGCRKRDYPPVFNYNTSWWQYHHVIEDYFARLSAVLSQGRPVRDVLVLHPATSAWAMLGNSPYGTPFRRNERDIPAIDALGYQVNDLLKYLMQQHIDFDLADELIMKSEAGIDGRLFTIKDAHYKVIVLPEIKSVLKSTYDLLMQFMNAGGTVVALKSFASMIEGREDDSMATLYAHEQCIHADDFKNIGHVLNTLNVRHISIRDDHGHEMPDILYMLKDCGDDQVLFLVNHNRMQAHTFELIFPAKEYQQWDLFTGEVGAKMACNGRLVMTLGASESALLVFKSDGECEAWVPHDFIPTDMLRQQKEMLCRVHEDEHVITLNDCYNITTDMPNSLTLDVCTYQIGGDAASELVQLWQAQRAIRDALGMRQVYYNGLAQRYKWASIPHDCDGTPVILTYTFEVEAMPDDAIFLAIESPQRFNITLNGQTMPAAVPGKYFIDRSIGIVPLTAVQQGLNTLCIYCDYKNSDELEDVYVLGDFGVSTDRRIVKKPKTIRTGDWCEQGFKHYAGSIMYHNNFMIKKDASKKYTLDVGVFSATLLDIAINNQHVGFVPIPAMRRIDITKFISDGGNQLKITVIGSPRNVFGPFHIKGGEPMNTSWSSFRTEGDDFTPDYNTMAYGLMDAVKIIVQ